MDSNNNDADLGKMHIPAPLIETHHSRLGVILGVMVVVLVLILGGLYLWGSQINLPAMDGLPAQNEPFDNEEPETPRAAADVQILETLSTSDELGAIEADLESTNLGTLDSELSTIENELDSLSDTR